MGIGPPIDLPEGNRTTDQALITFSLTQHCVVVTKDSDLVETFLLRHEPWKLLLVSTGNIDNDELLRLFHLNIDQLTESFKTLEPHCHYKSASINCCSR